MWLMHSPCTVSCTEVENDRDKDSDKLHEDTWQLSTEPIICMIILRLLYTKKVSTLSVMYLYFVIILFHTLEIDFNWLVIPGEYRLFHHETCLLCIGPIFTPIINLSTVCTSTQCCAYNPCIIWNATMLPMNLLETDFFILDILTQLNGQVIKKSHQHAQQLACIF